MVADRRDFMSGAVSPDTLFNILGSAHCWEVLACLVRHSCTVSGLADLLELEVNEISRSLQRLYALGLVQRHQFKKYRLYGVAPGVRCIRVEDAVHMSIEPSASACLSITLVVS